MQCCGARLHSSRNPGGGRTGEPIGIRVPEAASAASVGLTHAAAPTPAQTRARNRLVIFAIALLSARSARYSQYGLKMMRMKKVDDS